MLPSMAASDGPPTKICKRDWEDLILAKGSYENTLPDDAMPFVNRTTELFAIIEENIKAIRQLNIPTNLTDYRKMKVCFAAQMFGAGKTMLGRNLVPQLKLAKSDLQAHLKAFLDKEKAKGEDGRKFAAFFIQEVEFFKQATRLYVDLRGISDVAVVSSIVARVANTDMPQQTDVAEGIAKVLMEAAKITQKPLFVHFDEIGGFQVTDLRKLRDGVIRTWASMNQEAVKGEVMPRIYFYFSGKSVPLLGLGSPHSPVGTRWIILDKLHEQHVGVIRKELLSEVECCAEIDGRLCQWTGGAPRLLLYTLRYLYSWKPNLSTPHAVDVAMSDAYSCFKGIDMVARDIFITGVENSPEGTALKDAWLQLLVLAQLKVPIQMNTEIATRTMQFSVEKLLSVLNVYITRGPGALENAAEVKDVSFYIDIMDFIKVFVMETYEQNFRTPLFFGDSAGAGLSADDVLERLVEHRIIVQACLADKTTWKALLSPLLDKSKHAGKGVQLDKHAPIKWMPAATAACKVNVTNEDTEEQVLQRSTIPPQSLTKVVNDKLRSNRIYRPRPKSKSADTIIKQEDFVLEIQDKSGLGAPLEWAAVCTEVEKSIKDNEVSLLFIALALGPELFGCVGSGSLCLAAGTYCISTKGFLLFRPREATQWTFQCSQGIWKPFDDNQTGEGKKCLQVRPSLEVIIASAEAVEGFLGSDDFNSVRRLACGKERSQKISIPFISRFFGFSTIKVDIAAEGKLSKAFCFLSCVLTDGELTDALNRLLWILIVRMRLHITCEAVPPQRSRQSFGPVNFARTTTSMDGTEFQIAGNAFKLTGAIADVAISASPLSESSAAVFASFLHASRGCQVAELKDARCSEAGCVDSFVRRCLLSCPDSWRQSRRRTQRL
ncbi:unnamed protein product [Symbiodinium microadriaticum]|nr:unnamed protein product [Symbiodinium microadriaticum]